MALLGSSFPVSPRKCSGFTISLFCSNSDLDFVVLCRTRTLRSSLRFSDWLSICAVHPTIHDGAMPSLSTLHPDHSGIPQSLVVTGVSIPFTAFSLMLFDWCKDLELFSAIVFSPRPTHAGLTSIRMADPTSRLSNSSSRPHVSRFSGAPLTARVSEFS